RPNITALHALLCVNSEETWGLNPGLDIKQDQIFTCEPPCICTVLSTHSLISSVSAVKVWDRVKLIESGWSPDKTHDEHQKTALTEQHKGTDGSAGISQEESQTESLNQGEDSEERGVETEGGNSKHPSSGTVPSSAPESPPAASPKTENEETTIHPPDSSPSLPHPPKSPPAPAPAPVQNQDQEEETEAAAAAESTDETGANQTAGAQREREKRGGQDGGSDGGGAQPSGAGGGGAENPTADPAQELPSSPEEEEDILRRGPDTDGGAAQCSEAGGGGGRKCPKTRFRSGYEPHVSKGKSKCLIL
ncbi:hypothetical protein ANANG_G00052870, partial [Anguilla anguilla]